MWEEGQRPRRHGVGGERHQGEGCVCVLRCAAAMVAATMEDGAAGRGHNAEVRLGRFRRAKGVWQGAVQEAGARLYSNYPL